MNLWKPNKDDRSAIRSGDKKIRIHDQLAQHKLKESNCPNCGKEIHIRWDLERMNIGGYKYTCVKNK